MKNMHFFIKNKHSEFLKILISYLLTFLIPLSLIAAGTSLIAINNASVQVEKNYESALVEVKNDVDRNLENLALFAMQLSEMQWVKKFMYSKEKDLMYGNIEPTIFQNSINELNSYKYINGFVSDLILYFNKNNLIISNIGKDNLESFFSDTIVVENKDTIEWKETLSIENNNIIIPPANILRNNAKYSMLTYIQSLPISQNKPAASLIAFIDENEIEKIIDNTLISIDGSICIYDSDNTLIACSSMNENLQQNISDGKIIPDGKSQRVKLSNGKEYKIFYSKSSLNNWYYIAYIPTNTIMTNVYRISLYVFIICLMSLVAGIVLAYILARRNYTPLKNLMKTISPDFLSNDIKNEYMILETALNNMMESGKNAEMKAELYKPHARNSFFVQLLKGVSNINSDLLEALDITFCNSFFTCISILFSKEQLVANGLKSEISAIVPEQTISFFLVDEDKENKTIILNYAYKQQLELFLDALKMCFNDKKIEYEVIGVGKTYQNIEDIQKSYSEAKMAIDYRILSGDNKVIYANKMDFNCENVTYYCPVGTEEKLINLLKCANWQEALMMCKEIENINNDGKHTNSDKISALYYHFAVTALNAVDIESFDIDEALKPGNLFSMDTVGEMRAYIAKLYKYVCEIITTEINNKTIRLKQDIIDYLNNNYNDSTLSLTSVANKFNVSSTFLSRFVKNQSGMNFLEYINRKRIEAAKLLLKEDITILQVGQLVGYDSDITFRRQFKKLQGITPGEYKKHIIE